uniref:Glutamate synthase-related protein n=1 Tax=Streptomyces sp. NBC_01393 TaxID=2903851 RepID=A0AAU3HZC1_9ACTN
MNGALSAAGFPEDAVRARARGGAARAFPPREGYGRSLYGAGAAPDAGSAADSIDALRLVPPVFMPRRLEKLIDLGREPHHPDVDLQTSVGGFRSPLPLYVSALGSTQVAGADLARALSRQAGRLGIPMVIGENVMPSRGFGRMDEDDARSLRARISAYGEQLPDGLGGVAVQQSTEDADAEVWNMVYSDPASLSLLESGRLAFELKVGQGAKPGLGGMTVLDARGSVAMADRFAVEPVFGEGADSALRCASPGTFTEEILRQQIRMMRNNYPRARVWVKLHPGRDVREAAAVAWAAGADAVTVDGAEGGSGWAPLSFLDHVGLPLGECLLRVGREAAEADGCLLASGRMWDGARAAKAMALGARAVGLGRAAFLAVDEDPEEGLARLVGCLELELRLIVSALGKYAVGELGREDLWPLPQDAAAYPQPPIPVKESR